MQMQPHFCLCFFSSTIRRVALYPAEPQEEDTSPPAHGNSKWMPPPGPRVPMGWNPVAVTPPWLLHFQLLLLLSVRLLRLWWSVIFMCFLGKQSFKQTPLNELQHLHSNTLYKHCESFLLQRAKGQTVQSQQTVQNQQTFQSTRASRHSTYSVTNGSQLNNSQLTNSQTRMVRPPSTVSQTDGRMGTIKTSKFEQQSAWVDNC